MRFTGQCVIRVIPKDDDRAIPRYFNLTPEHGGGIALMDNLGFATSFTYPEAWLMLQNPKARAAAGDMQMDIQVLVDMGAPAPALPFPTLDHHLKGK